MTTAVDPPAYAGEVAESLAPTQSALPAALAYSLDDAPVTDRGISRSRWMLSAAALAASAAALIGASTYGVETFTATPATPAPVTITVTGPPPAPVRPPEEAAFLADLELEGVSMTSPAISIHDAQVVCKASASGMSAVDIAKSLADAPPKSSIEKAQVFVAVAMKHYCPAR